MEKLLTVKEVAELLGLTRMSIYLMVHRGQIPHVKIGERILRFDQEEIRKWLEAKKRDVQIPVPKPKPAPKIKPTTYEKRQIDRLVELARVEALKE